MKKYKLIPRPKLFSDVFSKNMEERCSNCKRLLKEDESEICDRCYRDEMRHITKRDSW